LLLQRSRGWCGGDDDHVAGEAHQLRRLCTRSDGLIAGTKAAFDLQVASLDPIELCQALPKCGHVALPLRVVLSERLQHADSPGALALLRTRRKRPCYRAADRRD
jgi:hypothetical protein